MVSIKGKPIGYELQEMADLYGLRGCCRKATCIHHKAKIAVDRIKELEDTLIGLKDSIEYHQLIRNKNPMFDSDYWLHMKPRWQKVHDVLKKE